MLQLHKCFLTSRDFSLWKTFSRLWEKTGTKLRNWNPYVCLIPLCFHGWQLNNSLLWRWRNQPSEQLSPLSSLANLSTTVFTVSVYNIYVLFCNYNFHNYLVQVLFLRTSKFWISQWHSIPQPMSGFAPLESLSISHPVPSLPFIILLG